MTRGQPAPNPAMLRLARKLEASGQRSEAQAVRLLSAQYRGMNFSDLVALINAASQPASASARVAQIDTLTDAFNRAAQGLRVPPAELTSLLSNAVTTGTSTGAQMLAAGAANPDLTAAFRVRPDREIALARNAAKRLELYWGTEQARFAGQVQGALLEGLERGQSPAQMAARLRERTGASRTRSLTIVRTETSRAMSAGNRLAQEEAGVTEFVWLSTSDPRTRPEHRARNGKKYRWDDPPDGELPGEPINCRCTALAVLPTGTQKMLE